MAAKKTPAEPLLLEVEAGTHRVVRESAGITRIAVGNPVVANVDVINRREVLITGKQVGLTSLLVWSGGVTKQYRLRVVPIRDPQALTKAADPELRQAVIEPGQRLDGRLPNVLAHQRALREAKAGTDKTIVDTSRVQMDSQVMTDIRIAEVSRTSVQKYGLNVLKNSLNTLAGLSPPGSITGIGATETGGVAFTSSSGFLPIQNAFNIVVGDPSRGLLGVLSLLEGKGLARTLAEPSLVAMSGQTASFLAGGEFPVPVSQGTQGITIQYKEFGVRLTLTPTILAQDRIALKVAPEVSDLNFAAAVSVGGIAVPSLTVRRTDTTVELGDGESFIISGLVSSNLLTNVDKVPWLGDVPILGAFFKSTQLSREEKELIMVVTPHLVRPLAQRARLPEAPGAEYDRYKPSTGQLIFMETGDFRTPTGFSR